MSKINLSSLLTKLTKKTGIRIPAALIYQLYTYYAKREKQTKPISDSALYKLIQESGFRYETMKNRKSDVEYIAAELKPIMEKFCPGFDEKWLEENKTNKSITCTINNDFWKALTAPQRKKLVHITKNCLGNISKNYGHAIHGCSSQSQSFHLNQNQMRIKKAMKPMY